MDETRDGTTRLLYVYGVVAGTGYFYYAYDAKPTAVRSELDAHAPISGSSRPR